MSEDTEHLARIARMLERIAVALEAWSIPTPPKEPVRQMPASEARLQEDGLLADGWTA